MADPVRYNIRAVEKQSGIYTAKLLDENGSAISSGMLSSLTLTLCDKITEHIINDRSNQNVLNANNVTLDNYGKLTWHWLPDDMTIVTPTNIKEAHIATFEAKWSDSEGITRQQNHEVMFIVNRIEHLS